MDMLVKYSRTMEKTPFARPMVVPVALPFLMTNKHGSLLFGSHMSGSRIKWSVMVPSSGSRRPMGYSNPQPGPPKHFMSNFAGVSFVPRYVCNLD